MNNDHHHKNNNNNSVNYVSGTVLSALPELAHLLDVITTLSHMNYYYLYYTDEETQAKRVSVNK